MVAVSIGVTRFSHELILKSMEFAINVPHSKLLRGTAHRRMSRCY
jgi:flavin reductase (DIM6/NTAB) family NADH-FMN oxidoreductase RutF